VSATIRAALRLSVLAAIALLAEPLTGVVDTMLAGRLGVVTALAFGLVLCAALVAVAMLADLGSGARGHLLARAAGLPVMAVVMAGYGGLRGGNAVATVSVLALSGAAVHVFLDVASVAWFPLGVTAFGLASTVSQLVVLTLLFPTMRRRELLPSGSTTASAEPSAWRQSAAAVLVLAARSAALGAGSIAMTTAAVGIGPTAGAAHQVTYQFWLLVVLVVEGWTVQSQCRGSRSEDRGQWQHLAGDPRLVQVADAEYVSRACLVDRAQPDDVGQTPAGVPADDPFDPVPAGHLGGHRAPFLGPGPDVAHPRAAEQFACRQSR
jgi:hypothetical protein